MRVKLIAFVATLILCLLPGQLLRPATATPNAYNAYLFVEIETKVYRKGVEISSENPEERRWYFSNIIVQPMDIPSYSLIKQFMPLHRNIMESFEAGIRSTMANRMSGSRSFARQR